MFFSPGGGAYEGRWRPPDHLSDRLRPTVASELAEADARIAPAERTQVARWLASLAVLVAGGRVTADDAKLKLDAYTAMLDGEVPASILTRSSLDDVARQFKFLPSYAELREALDQLESPLRRRADKLRRLLDLPAPPPPWTPPTQEEMDRVSAILAAGKARKIEAA